MSAAQKKRLLAVGNCSYDLRQLSRAFGPHFSVQIDAAASAAEALAHLRKEPHDLALVNRVFHGNGEQGLALIQQIKADPALASTPVMLLSNYAERQQAAVAAGAAPGFGKNALDDAETIARLRPFLG